MALLPGASMHLDIAACCEAPEVIGKFFHTI
jgi:hypothetical protein